MAEHKDSEEVRSHYIAKMGEELGSVYFRLWNECVYVHWKWEEFVALFGTNPKRVAIMNEVARSFFHIVQTSLWEDLLLQIARLTDPPRSAGKDNLTVTRLPDLAHPEIKPELSQLIGKCLQKCEFARDWRKRWIAHRDLHVVLGNKGASPLANASRENVMAALDAIAAVLNAVELHYCGSTVMYELRPAGNAESLLYVLRDGIRAKESRLARIKARSYTSEDLGLTEPF